MALTPSTKIGFLGAGNMAEAIIRGLLASGAAQSSQIIVMDIRDERTQLLADELGVGVVPDGRALAADVDVLVFAVKPQGLDDVVAALKEVARPGLLAVSILVGTKAEKLERGLAHDACPAPRVVRAMPNTPALIRMGATGICPGAHATDDDLETAKTIFDAVGHTEIVEPDMMDVVTGLAGSGPAYIFRMIEALTEAGVKQGLTPETAERLVKQVVAGAGRMALESEHPPAELRRRVTSPGGTTAAGLQVLDQRAFLRTISETVDAAVKRSVELGK